MLIYSWREHACFKNSNFFKVNDPELTSHSVKNSQQLLEGRTVQLVHTIPADQYALDPKVRRHIAGVDQEAGNELLGKRQHHT
jgi:hypothetical protein